MKRLQHMRANSREAAWSTYSYLHIGLCSLHWDLEKFWTHKYLYISTEIEENFKLASVEPYWDLKKFQQRELKNISRIIKPRSHMYSWKLSKSYKVRVNAIIAIIYSKNTSKEPRNVEVHAFELLRASVFILYSFYEDISLKISSASGRVPFQFLYRNRNCRN